MNQPILKEKDVLHRVQILSFSELTPTEKGGKIKMAQLFILLMYIFTLQNEIFFPSNIGLYTISIQMFHLTY